MAKKIVIDTDKKRGQLFKVSEAGGRFYIYHVAPGVFFNNQKTIGESKNLQDAIEIIKSSVDGSVRNVKIEDW